MTPRRSRGRRLVLVAVALLAVLLGGCASEIDNGQNSLDPQGPAAQKIFDLYMVVVAVAVLIGVAVVIGTVVIAIRFRYRPGKNENPKQIHGNTKLEIGWTILPALILAVIAVPTVSTIFDLAKDPGPEALEVTAVGKQWWWEFNYPGQKIVTANELVIPAGRPVKVHLTACEGTGDAKTCNVIHSFWVPELNGKKDVVPGHDNWTTIEADEPGTYLGQCAEFCGLSHANMRFRVIAKSKAGFEQWVSEQQEGSAAPLYEEDGTTPAGDAQKLITDTFACTNCHVLDDSSKTSYGPNLTHLASRSTFASGTYELTRQNLIKWVMDAPSMIPMESQGCRLPPGKGICVGMPSFTENTPPGLPTMTRTQAEQIADYLLELK